MLQECGVKNMRREWNLIKYQFFAKNSIGQIRLAHVLWVWIGQVSWLEYWNEMWKERVQFPLVENADSIHNNGQWQKLRSCLLLDNGNILLQEHGTWDICFGIVCFVYLQIKINEYRMLLNDSKITENREWSSAIWFCRKFLNYSVCIKTSVILDVGRCKRTLTILNGVKGADWDTNSPWIICSLSATFRKLYFQTWLFISSYRLDLVLHMRPRRV